MSNRGVGILVLTAAFVLLPLFGSKSYAQTDTAGASTSLDEIVVSARRRDENLQDVPMAIQTFGAEDLENSGIKSFREVATRIPGMIFNDTAGNSQEIFIRGIGNTLTGAATENSFGVFIDGVAMPRSTGGQIPLFDLERAEVLKGSQSLRFGKNIVGGLINYVTKKPTDDFEGTFEAVAGNFDNLEFSGSVRGPISETVKYSVTGISQAHDGYADNTNSENDPQAIARQSLRGHLLFEPRENLSVLLSADYNRARNTGRFDHIVESGDSAGITFIRFTTNPIPELPGFILPDRNVPFLDPSNREGPRNFTGYQNSDISGLSATVDWENDNGLSVRSVTSVRKSEQNALDDSCGIYWDFPLVDVGDGMLIPDPGEAIRAATNVLDFLATVPNCWLMVRRNEEVDSISQELRLSGVANDSLSWAVGVYYLDEDVSSFREQAFLFPDATVVKQFGGCLFGGPPSVCGPPTGDFGQFGPGGGLNFALTESDSTNLGVFAEINYSISDQLELNVGVRAVRDDKDFLVRREGEALGQAKICQPDRTTGLLPEGCDAAGVFRTGANDSWNDVLPEVSLTYSMSDDAILYGRYAEGYKPGGWTGENSGTPIDALTEFRPEYSTTAEIGTKLLLADRRVRLNIAAHYTEYEDLQIQQFVTFDDGRPSNIFTVNAKDGTTAYGVELDLTAAVTENITLFTNYAYTKCEFSGSIIIDSRGTDIDGNSCQRTPENGVSAGVQSRVPLNNNVDLTLGADYQWKDEFYFNNLNAPTHLIKDESVLNARAGLSSSDDTWDLQLWVKNATDEDNTRHMFVLWGSTYNTFQRPRTYGVTFRRRF